MPNSERIISHGNWEYGFILTQLVEMLENSGTIVLAKENGYVFMECPLTG